MQHTQHGGTQEPQFTILRQAETLRPEKGDWTYTFRVRLGEKENYVAIEAPPGTSMQEIRKLVEAEARRTMSAS